MLFRSDPGDDALGHFLLGHESKRRLEADLERLAILPPETPNHSRVGELILTERTQIRVLPQKASISAEL